MWATVESVLTLEEFPRFLTAHALQQNVLLRTAIRCGRTRSLSMLSYIMTVLCWRHVVNMRTESEWNYYSPQPLWMKSRLSTQLGILTMQFWRHVWPMQRHGPAVNTRTDMKHLAFVVPVVSTDDHGDADTATSFPLATSTTFALFCRTFAALWGLSKLTGVQPNTPEVWCH